MTQENRIALIAKPAVIIVRSLNVRDLLDNVGYSLPLAFKSSADVHVPLPYASSLRDKFLAAIANKLDTKDCISIYEITRKLAGLNSSCIRWIYKYGCNELASRSIRKKKEVEVGH